MSGVSKADASPVGERFVQAVNDHDLEAIVDCFASDYHDVEPTHPARQITGGQAEVRKNWGTVRRPPGLPSGGREGCRGG